MPSTVKSSLCKAIRQFQWGSLNVRANCVQQILIFLAVIADKAGNLIRFEVCDNSDELNQQESFPLQILYYTPMRIYHLFQRQNRLLIRFRRAHVLFSNIVRCALMYVSLYTYGRISFLYANASAWVKDSLASLQ